MLFGKKKKTLEAVPSTSAAEETPKAPARTVADIQVEYQNLCTKAGHLQYQIFALQKDLDTTNSTLRDLNLEAAALQAKERAAAEDAAKAVAEAKTEENQGDNTNGSES